MIRIYLLSLTYLVLLLFTNMVSANSLKFLLSDIKTYQANYHQTSYDNHGALIGEQKGTMAYLRPNQLRWQTLEPDHRNIIISKRKMWIYDVDLMQVMEQDYYPGEGGYSLLNILQNFDSLAKKYAIIKKNENTISIFELTLKNTSASDIKKMLLHFNGNRLVQLTLLDQLDHIAIIKLNNIKRNQAINPNFFTFKTPKGVDYIKS